MAYEDYKINSFTSPVSDLADKPTMSAAALKAWFDANSGEIQTALNALIDELSADKTSGDTTVSDILSRLGVHLSNTSNPHSVSKAQVGLGNVDNTSDVNKPVSTAQQAEFDLKADKTELHTHANKSVIDGITASLITAWNDAVTNKHTHSNKAVIDTITQTLITAWNSAVTDKHTHDNKNVLDVLSFGYLDDIERMSPMAHTHSNMDLLNAITEAGGGGLPIISATALDTLLCESETSSNIGVYLVDDSVDETGYGYEYSQKRSLLLNSYWYWDAPGVGQTRQVKIDAYSGNIYTREYTPENTTTYETGWSAWKNKYLTEVIPPNVITQGDDYTSYTFMTNKVYTLNSTATAVKTFTLTTPTDKTVRNEIELYYKGTTADCIGWATSNIKFADDATPSIEADHHYRILAEWHPIMAKWCITVKDDGVVA